MAFWRGLWAGVLLLCAGCSQTPLTSPSPQPIVSATLTPSPRPSASAEFSTPAISQAEGASQVPTAQRSPAAQTRSLGKVAFIQGGNLWVQTLPDGTPHQMTTQGGVSEPRWSPSGEWLAFQQDGQLWQLSADGQEGYPLAQGAPVAAFGWSPVEDRLAFLVGSGVLHLRAVNADGTGLAVLAPPGGAVNEGSLGQMAWHPQGSMLAYEWRRFPRTGPDTHSIWLVSAYGDDQRERVSSAAPDLREAQIVGWTSDGGYLLYRQQPPPAAPNAAPALFALPLEAGEPLSLTTAIALDPDLVAPQPGATTMVALIEAAAPTLWGERALHVVDVATGARRTITPPGVAAGSPAWSPSGQLAYVGMAALPDAVAGQDNTAVLMRRRLWLAPTAGSTEPPAQLTNDLTYRDEAPQWSADGQQLLFARLTREGQASLWLIPAGGGDPRHITDFDAPLVYGESGALAWAGRFAWWQPPQTSE